jgi:DNA anti-recombination protein RmuC
MMKIKTKIDGMIIGLFLSCVVSTASAQDGFTQADRDRIIRLEAVYSVFSQQVDKRFEQVDKRFEQVDKRFEQVDKRFEELRADMNTRFEQVDKRFEELRTDTNARFEQMTNMFYMLSALFTTLFAAVFGFAWWDRRSILITARKAAREEAEQSTRDIRDDDRKIDRLIDVLRGLAEKMPDLKELMHRANFL